jgi:hypothetical protein
MSLVPGLIVLLLKEWMDMHVEASNGGLGSFERQVWMMPPDECGSS